VHSRTCVGEMCFLCSFFPELVSASRLQKQEKMWAKRSGRYCVDPGIRPRSGSTQHSKAAYASPWHSLCQARITGERFGTAASGAALKLSHTADVLTLLHKRCSTCESSTSLTFRAAASASKGFCMKFSFASSNPWRTIASSV
jgi:hypothetical protein